MPSYLLVARVPASGVPAFLAYEDAVLALLARHGGRLDRRERSSDGTLEVHLLTFAASAGLAQFRSDPGRVAVQHLLRASGAEADLYPVLHPGSSAGGDPVGAGG